MFTTRPELVGTHGMVASTHWLASSAGMAVLESGGNAFDAAVAAGLTLQVVEPHLNGPGGEVPIIFHSADRAQTLVIGGQGPAPAAASTAHFEELGLDLVPGTGLLAACVPGAFDAWMVLLGEFGTLRLSEVMRYAIYYAEHGYPLVPSIRDTIRGSRSCSVTNGSLRQRSICAGQEFLHQAACSLIPTWPVPCVASSKRPSREALIATSR